MTNNQAGRRTIRGHRPCRSPLAWLLGLTITNGCSRACETPGHDSPGWGDTLDSGAESTLDYSLEQTGPLSYRFTFSTADAVLGRVRARDQGSARIYYVQSGTEPRTEHTIDISLKLDERFEISVQAVDDSGSVLVSSNLELETTAVLPLSKLTPEHYEDIQVKTEVVCPEPDLLTENAVFLTNMLFGMDNNNPYGIIWDRTGTPVWAHFTTERVTNSTGDILITVLDDYESPFTNNNKGRTLLFGGGIPRGTRVTEVAFDHTTINQMTTQGEFMSHTDYLHHTYRKNSDGTYTTTTSVCEDGCSDRVVLHDGNFDPLENEDPSTGVLWDVDVGPHVNSDNDYFSNTAIIDLERNLLYYYAQGVEDGIIHAFDRDTMEKKWVFGPGVQGASWGSDVLIIDEFLDTGNRGDPWFYSPHGIDIYQDVADGEDELRILMHDNGRGHESTGREYVSVVEYRIDTSLGTVEVLWSYPNEDDFSGEKPALMYSNSLYGNAEKVGDNVVVFSGSVWEGDYEKELPAKTLIMELRPDYAERNAELLWRMTLETQTEGFIPTFYSGQTVRDLRGVVSEETTSEGASRVFGFSNTVDYQSYWDF